MVHYDFFMARVVEYVELCASWSGHAYSCKTVEECAKIAETERSTLVRIKSSLEEVLRCKSLVVNIHG
jgi:hypothetical protein